MIGRENNNEAESANDYSNFWRGKPTEGSDADDIDRTYLKMLHLNIRFSQESVRNRSCNSSSNERVDLFESGEECAVEGVAVPFVSESISEAIVRGRMEERDQQVKPCLIRQVRIV